MKLTAKQAAAMVDHTNLHADADNAQMKKLCDEAKEYGFAMVAVNQVQSKACSEFLAGTPQHTGAAIAFPLGQTSIEAKAFETKDALEKGADEIDYVVNLTAVKDGDWDYIEREMQAVVDVCRAWNKADGEPVICKVIFENCYLTDDEKVKLCEVAAKVKPDFVKTSTGFGTGGATVEDVRLMRANVPEEVKVKAAGGIRDAETFLAMVEAGADRIGTSAGIKIVTEMNEILATDGKDAFEIPGR
jgi:deoxyribose-phosphate aldolase